MFTKAKKKKSHHGQKSLGKILYSFVTKTLFFKHFKMVFQLQVTFNIILYSFQLDNHVLFTVFPQ